MFFRNVPPVCIALVLLLSLPLPATAQDSATQQQLSENLAALVRTKWEVIQLETSSANEEWAGRYRSSDGPTVTTDLAWSPVAGFIVWWENCSRPISRVNHGSAVFQNDSLKLSPEVSASTAGSFSTASEFVPVKWGAQHFLIPRDQLLKFVYAVNSKSISELESFLLKVDDADKNRRGRPVVPPQYARFLGMKPINATISKVGPKAERWHPNITLNVGKRAGVIPEMKFYRVGRNHFFVLEVISVAEHTSEAAVTFVSGDNYAKKFQFKAGWSVSSRAPKGHESYLP